MACSFLRIGRRFCVSACAAIWLHGSAALATEGQACLDNQDCHVGEACIGNATAQQGVCTAACSWPLLKLVVTGKENYTGSDGNPYVRYKLAVQNWNELPSQDTPPSANMFAPAPDLPPCGLNANSSRSWLDIYDGTNGQRIYGFCALPTAKELANSTWFGIPVGTPPPGSVYVKLLDRGQRKQYCSNKATVVQ